MLLNNIELDIKTKCLEQHLTQAELAKKTGAQEQYINRVIKGRTSGKHLLTPIFVRMLEALGYDILITYVPREKKAGDDIPSRTTGDR